MLNSFLVICRNQDDGGSLSSHFKSDTLEEDHGYVKNETPSHEHSKYHYSVFKNDSKGMEPLHLELNSDILGPETPAMRPLVPRLKRVQEDPCDSEIKYDSLLLPSSKRLKSIQDSVIEQKTHGAVHESLTSKFEWLDPSAIRDANGRQPSDPLYDKRTLDIPSDALKKMSASQKQYWSVKCQYMDVVLFFKVVSSNINYTRYAF